jgi:hypothetical protein
MDVAVDSNLSTCVHMHSPLLNPTAAGSPAVTDLSLLLLRLRLVGPCAPVQMLLVLAQRTSWTLRMYYV